EENYKRMARSADSIVMKEVPRDIFFNAITTAVKMNANYIPPYGTGASLYIRPLLIGSGAQVGVKPAEEYMFMVFVGPVGPYFKEGFNPVKVQIVKDYDRAAPQGTGQFKVGGNYAASLKAGLRSKSEGFATALFLDPKEKKYIDEAGPANFFGIKNNTYITPKSESILPSITNMSLQQLAEDMGMEVERRSIAVEELETFDEVGACGTAAIISPIGTIVDRHTKKTYEYCESGVAGPISTKMYVTLRAIQEGEEEDKYGWTNVVEGV
ncbi:MAG: branched-chain amino acid aminotransferase, partial [Bacteroidales bacterium]|nr:branched-chain amino acid aminotransferase [Bacteroidales bacterium]